MSRYLIPNVVVVANPQVAREAALLLAVGARHQRQVNGYPASAELLDLIKSFEALFKAARIPVQAAVEAVEQTEWLPVARAAELVGVTRQTIYNMVSRGDLFGRSFDRQLLIDAEEVRRLAAERAVVKASQGESKAALDEAV